MSALNPYVIRFFGVCFFFFPLPFFWEGIQIYKSDLPTSGQVKVD